jgi:hypothetical protein
VIEIKRVVSAIAARDSQDGYVLAGLNERRESNSPGIGGHMKCGHVGIIFASKPLNEDADVPSHLIDDFLELNSS